MSPTRIDKSKGQQEDSGASSKRKRLQEAQEVCMLDTQWSLTLFLFSVCQNLFHFVGRPLYQRKTKCLMKTLLAQELKFGGQMTKCKSDDQHMCFLSVMVFLQ